MLVVNNEQAQGQASDLRKSINTFVNKIIRHVASMIMDITGRAYQWAYITSAHTVLHT